MPFKSDTAMHRLGNRIEAQGQQIAKQDSGIKRLEKRLARLEKAFLVVAAATKVNTTGLGALAGVQGESGTALVERIKANTAAIEALSDQRGRGCKSHENAEAIEAIWDILNRRRECSPECFEHPESCQHHGTAGAS